MPYDRCYVLFSYGTLYLFLCVLFVHELSVRDIFRRNIYTIAPAILFPLGKDFLILLCTWGIRPPSVTRPKALNGRGLRGTRSRFGVQGTFDHRSVFWFEMAP